MNTLKLYSPAVRFSEFGKLFGQIFLGLARSRAGILLLAIFLSPLLTQTVHSENATEVTIPLHNLSHLIDSSGSKPPRYAFGEITGVARFEETDRGPEVTVDYSGTVQSYTKEPTFIPILPASVNMRNFNIDGNRQGIALNGAMQGLVSTEARTYKLTVSFTLAGSESHDALQFSIPSLGGEACHLTVSTATGLGDFTLSPTVKFQPQGTGGDLLQYDVLTPRAETIFARFRKVGGAAWTSGNVSLEGTVTKGNRDEFGSQWHSQLTVDLFQNGTVEVPLLPESVALRKVTVDTVVAPLLVKDNVVVALVSGKGRHVLDLYYDVSARYLDGIPSLNLPLVDGATRSLTVTLPGDQQVTINPVGGMEHTIKDGHTTVTASLPRSPSVQLSWREAVPEQEQERVTMSASTWHLFHSEEGILIGQATTELDIRQGGMESVTVQTPRDIQVDSISSSSAKVVDWRVTETKEKTQNITIYLDRRLEGIALLNLRFDIPLALGTKKPLPLINVLGSTRQRGAAGLISTRDAGLRVDEEATLTRIGESGFPTTLVQKLPGKLTYGFKYSDTPPTVTISQTPPVKVEGRFNGSIESVLTVGDVGVHGSIEGMIEIKTGRLALLQVELPKGPQVLSVVAPSLRDQRVIQQDNMQVVEIEFTQEMEGSLRFEINYELLISQEFNEAMIPMIHLAGADLDRGRIVVESRSATEITPKIETGLTVEDPAELPSAIIARTAHPILRAYSYVWQTKSPPQLQLAFKRHHKQDLPPARISEATHSSLIALNGSLTTTTNLIVMNIREQFLKVTLPSGGSFLSLSVDGKPETPVVAEGEPDTYLIKLASNQAGFQIAFTYADHTAPLGILSWPTIILPRFSLHSDNEHWTISYPAIERGYYVNSSFDNSASSPGQGIIQLQKPYTPVQAPRTVSFIVISENALGLLQMISLLSLPLLYLIWAIKRPTSQAVLFSATGLLALVVILTITLREFSLIWNIGLTVLLHIAIKAGEWNQALTRALSGKRKVCNVDQLAEALKDDEQIQAE
jgi:hypothetical protein